MIEIFDYVFCAKVIMPNVYGRQNNGPQDDHVMKFGIQIFYVT